MLFCPVFRCVIAGLGICGQTIHFAPPPPWIVHVRLFADFLFYLVIQDIYSILSDFSLIFLAGKLSG